jgi:hypothetical protein
MLDRYEPIFILNYSLKLKAVLDLIEISVVVLELKHTEGRSFSLCFILCTS